MQDNHMSKQLLCASYDGLPNDPAPLTTLGRETHLGNLPNPRRWLSSLLPEFRTPKVFYPITQGRAAHPGDSPHTHRLRTPKVFYNGFGKVHHRCLQAGTL